MQDKLKLAVLKTSLKCDSCFFLFFISPAVTFLTEEIVPDILRMVFTVSCTDGQRYYSCKTCLLIFHFIYV